MSVDINDSELNANNLNIGNGTQNVITTNITNAAPLVPLCPRPPAAPKRFGGRLRALNALCDSLEQGDFNILALTAVSGLGGIGKTTLATKAANELFDQKVFRAVLHATISRDPNPIAIFEKWARDVGGVLAHPADADPEQLASSLKNLLETNINATCEHCDPPRVLVYLDDVWNDGAGRGKDAVNLLCQACPSGSTVLITTRFEGLAFDLGATPQSLDRLKPEEGVELLQTYKYLETLDAQALQALSEALGGHALALDLAAKRIGKAANKPKALHDHAVDYAKRIPLGEQFKTIKLDQGDKREESLTTVLSYSYNDLPADDQARFRQLGILPPDVPFDVPMLSAIWDVEKDAVETHCDALRLASLLEIAPNSDDGCYRQHPLLRAYALALLKNSDEMETTFARYADHVNQIAELFWSLPPERWLALTPYLPHIHTIGSGLVARTDPLPSDPDEALLKRAQLFAFNTSKYVRDRREMRQIDWSEMGLRVSQALKDDKQQARFLNNIGKVYDDSGNKRQALDYFEQALPVFHEVGDKSGEAAALNNIGAVYSDLGDKRQALDYFEQALPVFREVSDKGGEAAALNNVGKVYSDLGDKRQALDYYEQALPMCREMSDRRQEAITLNNIGKVYDALGDKRQALDYYEQALPIQREVGDKDGEATTLNNIGAVYDALGDKRRALDYFEQALPLRREVGDKDGEATTLNNIGKVYDDLGDKRQGLDYYEQALPVFRKVGNKGGEAATLNNVGRVYSSLGDKRQGLDYYEQALPVFRKVGNKGGEAAALNNIGMVYSSLGDKRQALAYLDQALQILREVGDKGGEAVTLNNIGGIYDALGDKRMALDYFEHALPVFREVSDKGGEVTTLKNIAYTHFQEGQLSQAALMIRQLIPMMKDINAPAEEVLFHANLAITLARMGQKVESIVELTTGINILKELSLPQDASGATLQQYEKLLAQLVSNVPNPPAAQTLPADTINDLVKAVVAAKTADSDKLIEWSERLRSIRTDFTSKGADWQIEVAFADALLALLDDQSVMLPEANPYYSAVQQVIDAIADYHKGA